MDNKPLETDDQEEAIEDLFVDTPEATPQEPGVEDVGGKLTLEEINQMAGREFKSKEDFEKHYKNLSSFVGKKEEKPKPAKEELTDLMAKVSGLEQTVKERDFIYEKPESKDHLDLVRSVSKAEGLSLPDAWEKVKDYVGAVEASKKEKTVVASKNRLTAPQQKEFQAIAEKARTTGLNDADQIELIKKSGVLS